MIKVHLNRSDIPMLKKLHEEGLTIEEIARRLMVATEAIELYYKLNKLTSVSEEPEEDEG